MSDMIRKLRVALQLETAAFEKGAKRSAAQVDQLGSKMEKAGFAVGRMGKAVIATGAVIAGSALISQLKDLVTQGLEYASSLGETAKQLGVSAKSLQEYRYAATQAGIAQEDMDNALAQLSKRLGLAAMGSKSQADAFKRMGIDAKEFTASGKDAGDLIPVIAEAMRNLGSDAERSAMATQIFGKAGQKLLPLLTDGATGVNALRKAAHEFGIVLSDKQIQNADDTADKMAKLNLVLKAQIAGIVADNAKEIGELATALAKLATMAVQAAAKMARFYNTIERRNAAYKVADDYLAGRTDLSPDQRERASAGARKIIDRRMGVRSAGGMFGDMFGLKFQPYDKAELAGGTFAVPPSPSEGWTPGGIKGGLAVISGGLSSTPGRVRTYGGGSSRMARLGLPGFDDVQEQWREAFYGAREEAIRLSYADEWEAVQDLIRRDQDARIEARSQVADRVKVIEERQIAFLSGMFQRGFQGGTRAIWTDFKSMGLQVISEVLARFVMARLGGGGGFSFGKALGSALGSVMGFANGGRPPVGRVSIVGERGPELFIPDSAGTVVPNGGFGGTSQYFDLRGAVVTEKLYKDMERISRTTVAQAAPALVQASNMTMARQMSRRKLGG